MTASTDRQQYRALVAEIAQKAKDKLPQCNGRVEKAVALVLQGDVTLHADGTATVCSATDPTRRYELGTPHEGYCTCKDWEAAPQHLCKHRLGAMIALRVKQALPPEPDANTTPSVVDGQAQPAPLPEAPASANVRVLILGHEVQLTLRGETEEMVLTRLQALLTRPDIRPIPPRPAPRSGGWQKRTQGH